MNEQIQISRNRLEFILYGNKINNSTLYLLGRMPIFQHGCVAFRGFIHVILVIYNSNLLFFLLFLISCDIL